MRDSEQCCIVRCCGVSSCEGEAGGDGNFVDSPFDLGVMTTSDFRLVRVVFGVQLRRLPEFKDWGKRVVVVVIVAVEVFGVTDVIK